MTTSTEKVDTRINNLVEKALIGVLSLFVGGQQLKISELDNRLYSMQATTFTEDKGRNLEERLTRRIESLQADTNAKLDTILYLISPANQRTKPQ